VTTRQPPQIIGLGPDSTPPERQPNGPITPADGTRIGDERGPSNYGDVEHRLLAPVVAEMRGGFAALRTAIENSDRDRRDGERVLLTGIRHAFDAIAKIRETLDADHEGDGHVIAWISDADRRLKALERSSSITNEVSLDALATVVHQKRDSVRARADRRALVVDGVREVGRGVRKIFESRPVQLAIVAVVAAAILAAREIFR
jgi:hypothetical protein